MKNRMHLTMCTALAACLSATVFNAVGQQTSAANNQINQNQNAIGQVAQADKVYGHEVLGSDNQKLGNLNNLVIDLESGRILYAVIGAKGGRVAVPPEIFTQTLPANGNLSVKATSQQVASAPKFDPVDKQGQWGQASFIAQVYQHFGQNAWWQGNTPANEGSFHNVHKASQVGGMKVQDVNNAPLGTIEHTIVDLPAGRVVYLMLSPDSRLNIPKDLYVLPPQAFTLSPNGNTLVSNLDAQKLAGAPHFPQNNWPNLADASYASQVYQYYGKQPYFSTTGSVQPTGR